MKLKNIISLLAVSVAVVSCSDDFLENKPQGPMTEANVNSEIIFFNFMNFFI